jgi:hypothetical protein
MRNAHGFKLLYTLLFQDLPAFTKQSLGSWLWCSTYGYWQLFRASYNVSCWLISAAITDA